MEIDMTSVFIELFKTQAYILSFVELLTDEQKDKFFNSFQKNLIEVFKEFNDTNPGIIVDYDRTIDLIKKIS